MLTRNETQRGSIDSPVAKASRSGCGARRAAEPADQVAELALDDQLREVLVGQPLAGRPARVRRGGEVDEDVLVEEVGERPVADVVEEPGDPERLDDEALARRRLAARRQRSPRSDGYSARAQSPASCMTPEPVGEPRVLGGREDPAGALELADPAQPLEPGRVEEVLLGGVLVGQAGAREPRPASAAWSARRSRGSGR